ncbi:uncharacterized protein [Diadema antillarum]|uniref:uncharacterized protein n=1 Tax=Diadema antillarum TaxID=105358 RepID=UPI003A868AF2
MDTNSMSRDHHLPSVLLLLMLSFVTQSSGLSIENLNVTDIGTTSVTFNWDVVGDINDTVDDDDLLRSYLLLETGLGIEIDSACLETDDTEHTFNSVQPYTSYVGCIRIVRFDNRGDRCNDDSTVVSTGNDKCSAVVTDFQPFSAMNITALAAAGGIALGVIIAAIINFACPKKKLNDSVDREKMREWSKKKRAESARDFLRTVHVQNGNNSIRS